jgi:hypothetical protein
MRLRLPQHEKAATHLYQGSVAPIAGWVSRAFDRRTPAPTIAWRARLTGTAVLRTVIDISGGEDAG